MLVMTTKVDKRKLIIAAIAVLAAIGLLLAMFGGEAQPTAAVSANLADTNDARVKFLTDLGWEVTASPTESMEVQIPRASDEVFDRYNELQKSQGYDLSKFAGKKIMRYVYEITNFPGATEPVYATLLIYKDQIIGGDVTNSAPGGQVQGFAMQQPSGPQS